MRLRDRDTLQAPETFEDKQYEAEIQRMKGTKPAYPDLQKMAMKQTYAKQPPAAFPSLPLGQTEPNLTEEYIKCPSCDKFHKNHNIENFRNHTEVSCESDSSHHSEEATASQEEDILDVYGGRGDPRPDESFDDMMEGTDRLEEFSQQRLDKTAWLDLSTNARLLVYEALFYSHDRQKFRNSLSPDELSTLDKEVLQCTNAYQDESRRNEDFRNCQLQLSLNHDWSADNASNRGVNQALDDMTKAHFSDHGDTQYYTKDEVLEAGNFLLNHGWPVDDDLVDQILRPCHPYGPSETIVDGGRWDLLWSANTSRMGILDSIENDDPEQAHANEDYTESTSLHSREKLDGQTRASQQQRHLLSTKEKSQKERSSIHSHKHRQKAKKQSKKEAGLDAQTIPSLQTALVGAGLSYADKMKNKRVELAEKLRKSADVQSPTVPSPADRSFQDSGIAMDTPSPTLLGKSTMGSSYKAPITLDGPAEAMKQRSSNKSGFKLTPTDSDSSNRPEAASQSTTPSAHPTGVVKKRRSDFGKKRGQYKKTIGREKEALTGLAAQAHIEAELQTRDGSVNREPQKAEVDKAVAQDSDVAEEAATTAPSHAQVAKVTVLGEDAEP